MYYIIMCYIIIYSGVAHAALNPDFREKFPELVKELCNSTIDYSLDRDTEIVSGEYHLKLDCLFNEALSSTVKQTNDAILDRVKNLNPQILTTPFKPAKACKNVLSEMQRAQETRRLQNDQPRTVCDTGGTFPTVENAISACRIGETAWSEFCGYQKYLWAKIRDEETFAEKYRSELKKSEDWVRLFAEHKSSLEHESIKSKRALEDMLTLYQEFSQGYALHAWLATIHENLRMSHGLLAFFRGIVLALPEKFINAATPNE